MNAFLKRILATATMVVFVTYSIPKEFYHIFSSHTDTQHEAHSSGVLEITGLHHHCQLLKADQQMTALAFEFPVLIPPAKIAHTTSKLAVFRILPFSSLALSANRLRGPPFL